MCTNFITKTVELGGVTDCGPKIDHHVTTLNFDQCINSVLANSPVFISAQNRIFMLDENLLFGTTEVAGYITKHKTVTVFLRFSLTLGNASKWSHIIQCYLTRHVSRVLKVYTS